MLRNDQAELSALENELAHIDHLEVESHMRSRTTMYSLWSTCPTTAPTAAQAELSVFKSSLRYARSVVYMSHVYPLVDRHVHTVEQTVNFNLDNICK